MLDMDLVARGAQAELARRYFWDYCQALHPKHYTEGRAYLKYMCEKMQWFYEQNEKRILVVNIPPRHYKSFTGSNFVEWVLGNDNSKKIMTGSYNETLSTTFARKVRNVIDTDPVRGGTMVYRHIFPGTYIKQGQGAAGLWALASSSQENYLATSPSGTATGFGANLMLIDDIIKNAEEAYNDSVLEHHWDWFTNTMMQRLEGSDYKIVIIMTRWHTNDLAGRILGAYPDEVEHIVYKAVNEDGSMLCPSILNKYDFDLKTREMNQDIIEANYNQKPIDIEGKLYGDFMTYRELPTLEEGAAYKVLSRIDTADQGTDFLCAVNYIVHDGDVFVTDVVCTDAGMETTEPDVSKLLDEGGVLVATVESNNGGRGFGRNVERLLKEAGNFKCVVLDEPQTKNKEARILASSTWVNKHVFMPEQWKQKYPEFYKQLSKYQKKGKNAHDDAPDVLASIYESVANKKKQEWAAPVF